VLRGRPVDDVDIGERSGVRRPRRRAIATNRPGSAPRIARSVCVAEISVHPSVPEDTILYVVYIDLRLSTIFDGTIQSDG
jgi:hypothetical protein